MRADGGGSGGPTRRAVLARTRIYLVATPDALPESWEEALHHALGTGLVGMVQLREKALDDAATVRRARRLRPLCDEHGALLLLDDRVHLVGESAADGVHVGEADVAPEEARRILGPDLLVGLSTHDEDEVALASARGADYAGLGPCYPTSSKTLERAPGGPDLVRRCLPYAGSFPVFPVGGITPHSAGPLAAAGARRLAVGAGVLAAPDPARAVRLLARHLPSLVP